VPTWGLTTSDIQESRSQPHLITKTLQRKVDEKFVSTKVSTLQRHGKEKRDKKPPI